MEPLALDVDYVGVCCPPLKKVIILTLVIFLYILVFISFHSVMMSVSCVSFIIPVIAFSWYTGRLGGLLTASLSIPINTLLFLIFSIPPSPIAVRVVLLFLLFIIAFVTGTASRLLCELNGKNIELEKTNSKLRKKISEVKELHGLLPICIYCKSIRDEEGYWHKLEEYIETNSKADLSNSICEKCYYEKMTKTKGVFND